MLGNSGIMTEKSLDYLWQKQKITMNNISNQNTPGFKAEYVTFEDELDRRLKLTGSKNRSYKDMREAIKDTRMTVHDTENEFMSMDDNNVDITAESAELARATIQYQYLIQSFNFDYNRLRTAIRGQQHRSDGKWRF